MFRIDRVYPAVLHDDRIIVRGKKGASLLGSDYSITKISLYENLFPG